MANQKKQAKTQLGKLSPLYTFFLNPYKDVRFTKCPKCESKMHQRKLPLVIFVKPIPFFSLNKTCRYCPHCDLLIAHQDDIEHILTSFFSQQKPEVVANDYRIIGTLERAVWKRGTEEPLTAQEILDALHDFKGSVSFKLMGGWMPPSK